MIHQGYTCHGITAQTPGEQPFGDVMNVKFAVNIYRAVANATLDWMRSAKLGIQQRLPIIST